jgi:hypothetical protein
LRTTTTNKNFFEDVRNALNLKMTADVEFRNCSQFIPRNIWIRIYNLHRLPSTYFLYLSLPLGMFGNEMLRRIFPYERKKVRSGLRE